MTDWPTHWPSDSTNYKEMLSHLKKACIVDNRPPLLPANNLLPLRVLLLADHLPALLGLPTLPPIMPLLDNICLVDEPARRKVSFLYFGLMEFD